MTKVKDGSPITNVWMTQEETFFKMRDQRKEDVLGEEIIFKLGSDSSAWPQNDNLSGNDLRDTEDLVEAYGLGW